MLNNSFFAKFMMMIFALSVLASCGGGGGTAAGGGNSTPGTGNAPVITSLTPTSGLVGTVVTVTGTDFDSASVVKFNGVTASGVVATGTTSLAATVPAGATTGALTVTTAGGTATSSTNFAVTTSIKGVAVDPYIVGATFCEDKNKNGACDSGELVSTASDSLGVFYFQSALTQGSNLLIKDKGTHNGVAFTGEIMRPVDQGDNLVVTPITTLLANGWTTEQIISVLTHYTPGIQGITAADLMKNPLEGIETLDKTTLTQADFRNVWATTAIHSFLSIMQGVFVGPGKGYHITYAMFTDPSVKINGQTPQWYVDRMVERIGMGLDPAILTEIDSQLTNAKTACNAAGLGAPPNATAGDVLRGSTAIADYVIKKVINDLTYAPTLAEYGPWRMELGRDFYIIRNKSDACVSAGIAHNALPNVTACSSFKINDATGLVDCIQ